MTEKGPVLDGNTENSIYEKIHSLERGINERAQINKIFKTWIMGDYNSFPNADGKAPLTGEDYLNFLEGVNSLAYIRASEAMDFFSKVKNRTESAAFKRIIEKTQILISYESLIKHMSEPGQDESTQEAFRLMLKQMEGSLAQSMGKEKSRPIYRNNPPEN